MKAENEGKHQIHVETLNKVNIIHCMPIMEKGWSNQNV